MDRFVLVRIEKFCGVVLQKFAIASGRISVNHKIVPANTVIKNGDLIIHTVRMILRCRICCVLMANR
jgi:ribosomal 50S subunit-recycling heat shock protein